MILEGEEFPRIHDVTQEHLLAVFDEEETDFGQFIILSQSDGSFIQSANMWELSEECEQFQDERNSDPYCLEYKNKATGELFAADGWFTLSEVKDAFVEYLRGTENWKENKVWKQIEY